MAESQDNFSNNQTASVDIEQLYTNIIQEIDKYRSYISVANNKAIIQQLINSLSIEGQSPDKFITQIKPDPKPQESRCHAFYRLIGLPVVAPDGKSLYSPGFDADNSFKREITNKHYQVISSIKNNKPALFDLMDARENNVSSFLKIFSTSNLNTKIADINGSVLLLSSVSGGKNYFNVRNFGAPLEHSTEPFDTDFKNQSYSIANEEPKNSINSANLTEYQDSNGQLASLLFGRNSSGKLTNPGTQFILKESPLIRRAHILKPFMVDPRVDLTVNPPKCLVCAPFALDNSKTKYNDSTTLPRPFIELICRKRFNKDNQKVNDDELPERYRDWVSYVKNSDQVIDQNILDKINQGVDQTIEIDILLNNLDIIRSMVDKLFESLMKIQEAEKLYHWIPIPDPNGPELAIITQDVKLTIDSESNAIVDPLSTPDDIEILTLTAKIELSNVNSTTAQADLGNFTFQNFQAIPDGTKTVGLNLRNQTHLDELKSKREEITGNAAEALRIIEIIMGEFSGLGLCDIIAIYTALWTVDKQVLVNMLDQEAFDRMYQDPTLRDDVVEARKSANVPTLSGTEVLEKFEGKVKEIYALMDGLLRDRFGF